MKNINIGFDAKRYFHNKSGLGVYSRNIIDSIFELTEMNIFLFNPKETKNIEDYENERNSKFNIISPNNFFLKTFHWLWRMFFISRLSKKIGIDIYHGLSFELPLFLSVDILKITTIHDLLFLKFPTDYSFIDVQIHKWKTYRAVKNSNLIITISNCIKNELIEKYKIDNNKIVVIPPILEFCDKSEAIELPKKYILMIGSFLGRKNHYQLLQYFKFIKDKYDFDIVFAGNCKGKNFEKVKNYVFDSSYQQRIHFIDSPTDSQKVFLYKKAFFSVYMSLYEGFGIPPFESIYYDCPVLVAKIDSLSEFDNFGLFNFFELGNREDFFDKIDLLSQNNSSLRFFISQNKNLLLDNYNKKKIIDLYIHTLKKASFGHSKYLSINQNLRPNLKENLKF